MRAGNLGRASVCLGGGPRLSETGPEAVVRVPGRVAGRMHLRCGLSRSVCDRPECFCITQDSGLRPGAGVGIASQQLAERPVPRRLGRPCIINVDLLDSFLKVGGE